MYLFYRHSRAGGNPTLPQMKLDARLRGHDVCILGLL